MKPILAVLAGVLIGTLLFKTVVSKQIHYLTDLQYAVADTKNIQTVEKSTIMNQAKAPEEKPIKKPELLILTDKNSVALRGPIMEDTIGPIQDKLIKLSQELPKDATIYLVLNTPGGSVDAGLALVDTIHGLPQKVATVNLFSASMGFHIAQLLDERLALPHSTLMSHRMAAGIKGQVPGELVTHMKSVARLADKEDARAAKRMGLTFEQYRQLIQDEYWVDGEDAVRDNAIDRVILARCDKSLDGEDRVDVQTLFGTFTMVYAQCPLITEPLRVEMPKGPTDESGKAKFVEFAEALSHDQHQFVQDYIVNGKYVEYLK